MRSFLIASILAVSSSAQSLEEIFKEGKASGQLRAFWFDGDRELRDDPVPPLPSGESSAIKPPFLRDSVEEFHSFRATEYSR